MQTFTFDYDQKCTVWERTRINIEAESKEDALNKLVTSIQEGEIYNTFLDRESEQLTDTLEAMKPEQNEGRSTSEIMDEEGLTIWNNTPEHSNESWPVRDDHFLMDNLINMIAKIISDQIRYNPKLNPDQCSDEINTYANSDKYAGFELVTQIRYPTNIERSENFQYLSDSKLKLLQIANKFF